MKFKITLIFIFICILSLFTAFYYTKYFFSGDQQIRSSVYPSSGSELVSFMSDNFNELYDYKGKPIDAALFDSTPLEKDIIRVFHFWAGWCDPCINEMPEVIKFVNGVNQVSIERSRRGQPLIQVFLISLDTDQNDLIKALKIFPDLNQLEYLQIWDKNNLVSRKSAVDKLPVTFVDRSRVKLQVYEGEADWKKITKDIL